MFSQPGFASLLQLIVFKLLFVALKVWKLPWKVLGLVQLTCVHAVACNFECKHRRKEVIYITVLSSSVSPELQHNIFFINFIKSWSCRTSLENGACISNLCCWHLFLEIRLFQLWESLVIYMIDLSEVIWSFNLQKERMDWLRVFLCVPLPTPAPRTHWVQHGMLCVLV